MNTSNRSILFLTLAATVGLFTLGSAAFAGIAATSTVIGVCLFVVVAMLEIILESYALPDRPERRPRRPVAASSSGAVVIGHFGHDSSERKAA